MGRSVPRVHVESGAAPRSRTIGAPRRDAIAVPYVPPHDTHQRLARRQFLVAAAASLGTLSVAGCHQDEANRTLEVGLSDRPPKQTALGHRTPMSGGARTPAVTTALDFPGDLGVNRQFHRTLPGDSIPDPYPITLVMSVFLREKGVAYQTGFFHGIRGGFGSADDRYYGAGPYPRVPPGEMRWEIAATASDFTGDLVQYNRWYRQAFVAWADASGKHHRFYYDLPSLSKVVAVDLPPSYFTSSTPTQTLVFGDAPWDHVTGGASGGGPGNEQLKGLLRRIKIFTSRLTLADVISEALSDGLATSDGRAAVWYLNANPKPDDLTDKSGRGHDFHWLDDRFRAGLYTGPG